MNLKQVISRKDEQHFLEVHVLCNQHDPSWIRPLDEDILSVFDRNLNPALADGDCSRWILLDNHERLIGRIAAFVNRKYKNKGDEFPAGGFGFFDCINSIESAHALFDAAKNWLQSKGMDAMDGPINFGERDKWWGLLVEGFSPPPYGLNYNPPYYQTLFESYGFQKFYDQICWSLPIGAVGGQLPSKCYRVHRQLSATRDFSARRIGTEDEDQFANNFCAVYNKAWAKHEGNKQMTSGAARKLFRKMKAVLDKDLIWFAFYKDQPAAMWIGIPDINEAIRDLKGKSDIWAKLKIWYWIKTGKIRRFIGIIYGVVPELQGTGVDYFLLSEAEKVIKSRGQYLETELQWQGDFNPKMINVSKKLGASLSRKLTTYRYLINENISFRRHPILD